MRSMRPRGSQRAQPAAAGDPRAGGERQALQALVAAREGAVNAKRAGLCQLRDLLITTPEPLRSELRPLTRARLLQRLAATRLTAEQTLSCAAVCSRSARSPDASSRSPPRSASSHGRSKHSLASSHLSCSTSPESDATRGPARPLLVPPRTHHQRSGLRRLAGAAPIPASSGQTIRYRLDRSGDRKLNRALHMILVTRKRTHPATIAYIERRIQEGKTRREANRCLKRYLARNLYRLLEHGPPMTT